MKLTAERKIYIRFYVKQFVYFTKNKESKVRQPASHQIWICLNSLEHENLKWKTSVQILYNTILYKYKYFEINESYCILIFYPLNTH